MNQRYFLSQFYRDEALNMMIPVCTAYGGKWLCPTMPSINGGWAIVLMLTTPQQAEAAKQDPRVVVLPAATDPTPLPSQIIEVYANWGAVDGMSLGSLLSRLTETEPTFGLQL